jgi:ribosomal protein S18 acetylase RimI-like enzyme
MKSIDEMLKVYDIVVSLVSHPFSEERHRIDLTNYFPKNQHLMLLVEFDGEIVGGTLGYKSSLFAIAIKPGHQGKGLGRRLLQTFEFSAMKNGVRMISVGADDEDKGFFQRMGYRGKRVSMSKEFPLPGRVLDLKLRKLEAAIGELDVECNMPQNEKGQVLPLPVSI